nr:EOG090X07PL [Ilyocryptus agilis]
MDKSYLTFLTEFRVDKDKFREDRIVSSVKHVLENSAGPTKEVYRTQDGTFLRVVFDIASGLSTLQLDTSSGLVLLDLNMKSSNQDVDERLLEYDVDSVVADIRSPYQRIQILHTINYGNLLLLDNFQNLAESDLAYTETLIRRGKIDYTDKEILILGAGDGALLWELLKEKPKMVTMVEIIVGDCMVELDKLKENGARFDFVFSDLTDIPLSTVMPQSKEWQFLLDIVEKSFMVLGENGIFLTHGSGASSVQSLATFENLLKSLVPALLFERYEAFVPSFMENWVFYQVWKAQDQSK